MAGRGVGTDVAVRRGVTDPDEVMRIASMTGFERVDHPLVEIVKRVQYKPDWTVTVDAVPGSTIGCRLVVTMPVIDSRDRTTRMMLQHNRPVPPAIGEPERWWIRWLFMELVKIEEHEASEFFTIDGEAPFFPEH